MQGKEGLGKAYLAGFHRALAEGAELVLEIDCDFSHDPKEVPHLIATCEAGADLALGSRWIEGGAPSTGAAAASSSRKAGASMPARSSAWACGI